jgi:hypothetical protein
MKIMNKLIKSLLMSVGIVASLLIVSCEDNAPEAFNDEETITKVGLIFSPIDEGAPVVINAIDPDGDGPADIAADGVIKLRKNVRYELFISFENTITSIDITEEVKEEAEEHMIFFSFTEGIFTNPGGNGNIDGRSDPVNYLDKDDSDLPLGLITSWLTADAKTGDFTIVLKHQPGIKSLTSKSSDGETDVSVTWSLEVE